MKTELKISTLSIICVLSTAIALPSFGASAVRSLGGAGTYSSASSAATAGEKPATGTVGSVRAGSLRANAPKSATSSKISSTRAGATPRLSIGKYLAGGSINGGAGSSSGSMGSSQAGVNDLKKTVDDLVVDVEGLKEEIASLTGEYPTIEFENGILTIVQDGVSEEIDLNDYFASEDSLQALEDKINEIVIPDLSEYAKISDLDGLLTSADLSELQSAVDALEAADVSMNAAIAALQGGMVTADDLNAKVEELKAVDEGLQAQIDNLKNSTPSTDGLVNKEYVDGLVSQLEAADVALQNAIAAIEQPDVDKAYVDAAIAGLNEAIRALQGADSTMNQAITDLQARLEAAEDAIEDFVTSSDVDNQIDAAIEGLATKQELEAAKSELQAAIDDINAGQVELTNYYTKAQADEIFATKVEVGAQIDSAVEGLLTSDDLQSAVDALQTAIDNLQNSIPSTEGLASKEYVDGAIADLNGTITDLRESLEDVATQDDIKEFVNSDEVDAMIQAAVAGLATDEEIADFVTNGKLQEEIAKLATKDEIANFVTSTQVSDAIANATKDLLTANDVAEFVKSGDMTTAIADATKDLATKQELADAIEQINASQADLTNYYTKTEADAKFATKDLGNADTAGVTKLYGTTGDSEEGAMTQKAVTEELNAISNELDAFDLDGVLRSAAAQGSYLINFDEYGNVSYAPIQIYGEMIGGDAKPLDLTVGAIEPGTTMSLN